VLKVARDFGDARHPGEIDDRDLIPPKRAGMRRAYDQKINGGRRKKSGHDPFRAFQKNSSGHCELFSISFLSAANSTWSGFN
jgi:hypothetical protein